MASSSWTLLSEFGYIKCYSLRSNPVNLVENRPLFWIVKAKSFLTSEMFVFPNISVSKVVIFPCRLEGLGRILDVNILTSYLGKHDIFYSVLLK